MDNITCDNTGVRRSSYRVGTIAVVTFESTVSACIIFGNSLTVIAVLKFPKMRTITNKFIVSLAIADLLVGLCMPYHITIHLLPEVVGGWTQCMIRSVPQMIALGASVFSLALNAVDRYIAILFPFEHISVVTHRRCNISICVSWLYWAGISATFTHWSIWKKCVTKCIFYDLVHPVFIFVIYGQILALFLIIAGLYIRVFVEAVLHYRRSTSRRASQTGTDLSKELLLKEVRIAGTLAIVVGAFMGCWVPYLVISTVDYFGIPIHLIIKQMCLAFLYMNSGINPLIYTFRCAPFRAAFINILRCTSDKSSSDNGESGGRSTVSYISSVSQPMA